MLSPNVQMLRRTEHQSHPEQGEYIIYSIVLMRTSITSATEVLTLADNGSNTTCGLGVASGGAKKYCSGTLKTPLSMCIYTVHLYL